MQSLRHLTGTLRPNTMTPQELNRLAKRTGRRFLLQTQNSNRVLLDGQKNPAFDNGRELHNEFTIQELNALKHFRVYELRDL